MHRVHLLVGAVYFTVFTNSGERCRKILSNDVILEALLSPLMNIDSASTKCVQVSLKHEHNSVDIRQGRYVLYIDLGKLLKLYLRAQSIN